MIKKKLKKLILIVSTFTIILNIDFVYAEGTQLSGGIEVSISNSPPENNEINEGNTINSCESLPNGKVVSQTSSPKSSWYIKSTKYQNKWNIYNAKDELLSTDTPALSGTAVGANLYEELSFEWQQSCYTEVKTTCEYEETTKIKRCIKESKCIRYDRITNECLRELTYNKCYYVNVPEKQNLTTTSIVKRNCTDKEYNSAKTEVQAEMDKTPSKYTVIIEDPNDISCAKNSKKEGCKIYEANVVSTYDYPERYKIVKRYNYEMYGTCVNVKTAKVRYLTNKDDNCKSDEIKIENYTDNFEKRHWHIFIPLNTKTTDTFQFLIKSNKKETGDYCKEVIDQNKAYFDSIIPGNSQVKFTGIKEIDKSIVEKYGCYFETNKNIPISQKFYNEENNGTTIKGFNFYYKQIDINNPFPNGVASDSYWYNSYDASTNKITLDNPQKGTTININLDDSFKQITYAATNIKLNEIREYNNVLGANGQKINLYSSWANMNTDGTSQFITNKNIITRLTNDKIYKLGCGPHNINEYLDANKTQKNPYYQKECVN